MGFLNNDGSSLEGGQLPSGAGKALQMDSSGNLFVNIAAGSSSGTQYTDGAAAPTHPVGGEIVFNKAGTMTAVSDTNGLPINGSITATNPSVGTDGAAIPTSSTLIGASDGTNLQQLLVESAANRNLRAALYNGANELAIDASGRVTLVPNQTVKVVDTAGTNQLAIDASGRLTLIPNSSMNMAQIAGVAPGLDNTNELRTSLYGKNVAAGDTAIVTDASGRIQTANYISGSAVSIVNPYPSADQIRLWIANGQGFSATTGKQTSAGAVQTGMCLFANSVAKNILIYSIRVGIAASSLHQLNLVTVDPAISGVTVTASNSKPGGATSLATLEAQNTAVTTSGNLHDFIYNTANTMNEFLGNGEVILLPSGAANGILVLINTSTNVWFSDIKWVEYT